MGNLSGIFDGVGTKPEYDNSPLPVGEYKVEIVKAEIKTTKDGTGNYINVQYKVIDGQYINRVVFGMLNIRNKNPEAQRIGGEQFFNLREAIGVKKVDDTDQLVGHRLQIKLGIRKSEQYGDQNDVKGFSALAGAPKPVAATPSVAPATQKAAPPWAAKKTEAEPVKEEMDLY